MIVSAVILSFNSVNTLPKCLDSLLESYSSLSGNSEIFVVDNGSLDGSAELLKEYQSRYPDIIKPIFFTENTGTTFSRNSAIKQATGEFVLVLDSDAYITPECLTHLIEYSRQNPEAGIVVPKLTYASGNFQLSCDVFPTLWQKAKRFLFLKNMEAQDTELKSQQAPVDVDYAISACWLITRECVDKTGLLDEKIFYSPEDVDYCIRVWKSGFKITYVPSVQMIHDAQELSRGFKLSKFHFSHLGGLFYLFKKHRYFWSLDRLYKKMERHR